ncbi:MAG: GIY-YIG nuclease family protein [Aurantimonas endophytica]|uniref:GIY-YIG nuclease family protein n=1 Tax=Aurantimonas endophytica TaxID=1522175 RepID=UPI003001370E
MLFQNYGLFWHADRVSWGTPGKGNGGKLLGFQKSKEDPIDFRQQRGVYALYDGNFSILYVGQAGYGNKRLYDRLYNHLTDHLAERWERFSWFGIDPVVGKHGKRFVDEQDPGTPPVNVVLDHLEAILIAAAEPALNRQGGKFGEAQQFRQYWDDDEENVTEMFENISQHLAEIESKLEE